MRSQGNEYEASFRLATPADAHLDTYDHTKLAALNTCPTWGILRYQMHKVMPSRGRSLALECGKALHECFAFIRLCNLRADLEKQHMADQGTALWNYHGIRLFGQERFEHICASIQESSDLIEMCKRGAIAVLDTSGFYDDPRDKRRTLSNMEECIFAYINRWRWDQPVWVRDPNDPQSDVGIEIAFDLVIEITGQHMLTCRLTGKIDGIHWNSQGNLVIHDNKTASRLNDAWAMSQVINHQYTGYCVAASVFTQHVVNHTEVIGLAVPLPKSYDYGGFLRELSTREVHHYERWLYWLVHTVLMYNAYTGDPYAAPKYTHSCNRYFRPCAFIPFCDADNEEQRVIVSEMEVDEWSPLHKEVTEGVGIE